MELFENYLHQQLELTNFHSTVPFFKIETIKEGAYFVREGNVCAKMGFVTYGVLKTDYNHKDGEVIRYFCRENQWVGHFESFEYQKKTPESVTALSDCQLVTISEEYFQSLRTRNKEWETQWAIIKKKVEEERATFTHLALQDPKSAYEDFIRLQPNLALCLPTEAIASYLQVPHQKLLQVLCEMVLFS